MELTGKKIAVFVENVYEDLELWYPVLRFREAGAKVTLIGPKKATYQSKHDYPADADAAIADVKAADFDALIVPGGYAPDYMRRYEAMVKFTQEMNRRGKIVAAICHAGWMLASADIVRGVRVTGVVSIKDDLKNAGGIFEDHEVILDKNIVTSRKPSDLPAFCRTIIAAVAGK
jgi:protease I